MTWLVYCRGAILSEEACLGLAPDEMGRTQIDNDDA